MAHVVGDLVGHVAWWSSVVRAIGRGFVILVGSVLVARVDRSYHVLTSATAKRLCSAEQLLGNDRW